MSVLLLLAFPLYAITEMAYRNPIHAEMIQLLGKAAAMERVTVHPRGKAS